MKIFQHKIVSDRKKPNLMMVEIRVAQPIPMTLLFVWIKFR